MKYHYILENLDLELTQIDVFSDELCHKLEHYKSKLLYVQIKWTYEKLRVLEKRQERVSNLYNKIVIHLDILGANSRWNLNNRSA